MDPSEQPQIQEQNNPVPEQESWMDYICDDSLRLAVPVGSRFQADLPDLIISPGKRGERNIDYESESSKWLGIRVWPTEGENEEIDDTLLGKGRPESCSCVNAGSVECTKKHTAEKRIQMQSDIGPAFWKWKFDNMGEDVSKLWNLEEQKKFQSIVKTHAKSLGQIFIKSAVQRLPCQSRESIISYYLNVHIPGRMSIQSRTIGVRVDTDDESEAVHPPKGPRKRFQAKTGTLNMCKYSKTNYMGDLR